MAILSIRAHPRHATLNFSFLHNEAVNTPAGTPELLLFALAADPASAPDVMTDLHAAATFCHHLHIDLFRDDRMTENPGLF